MVRCFVGFLIQGDAKERIKQVIKELEKFPMECKFVEEENLHLCFSFLGEVKDDQIKNICDGLDSVANNHPVFEVKIHGMKAIPNKNYIRVLALDVTDESGTLIRMAKHVQEKIGGDAKPPHLTLCRVKSIKNKEGIIGKIEELQNKEVTRFTVSAIQLIKSELSRTGPIYAAIHESKFKV